MSFIRLNINTKDEFISIEDFLKKIYEKEGMDDVTYSKHKCSNPLSYKIFRFLV